MSKRPILTEVRYKGTDGEYLERWMCEPPPLDVNYRVLEQEWDEEFETRTIYRVELESE